MPNWVHNKVRCANDSLVKKCVTAAGDFDFNRIIRMPKEIKDTESPNRNKELAEHMTRKYGSPDWYNWACDNWGTKWNARDTVTNGDFEVDFDTAWSTPLNVIVVASKKFDTTISVEFADEDISSSNCGRYIAHKGEIISMQGGNEEFADYVWGYRDDYDEDSLVERKNN